MKVIQEVYGDWVELVVSKGGQIKIIQRPIQHIYPLEVRSSLEDTSAEEPHSSPVTESSSPVRTRSTRQAAAHARDLIVGVMMENEIRDDELSS